MPDSQSSKRIYAGVEARASGRKCIDADAVVGRLRTKMEEMRMNQNEFAGYLNVSPAMLSQVLSGQRAPGDTMLECIKLRRVDHFEAAKD